MTIIKKFLTLCFKAYRIEFEVISEKTACRFCTVIS